MKKYRVVVETEESGHKFYYIQKRCCLFFWKYLKEYFYTSNFTWFSYRIPISSLEKAQQNIENLINEEKESKIKIKIIKKEIL